MFLAEGIDVYAAKAKIHCTLILAKLFNSMMWSYDLKDLAARLLGRGTEEKTAITEWIKANSREWLKLYGVKPNFHDAPPELVAQRAQWDTESTLKLFEFLHPRVMKTCPDLYETERQLQFCVLEMETTGVRVDLTQAKMLRLKALTSVVILENELNRLVCPLTVRRARCKDEKCKRHKKNGICPVFYDRDIPPRCPVCTGEVEVFEQIIPTFNANSSAVQLPSAFVQLGISLVYKTKPKKGKKGGRSTGGGKWCFDEYAMIRYVSAQLGKVIRDSGEANWPAEKFFSEVLRVIDEYQLDRREILPPLVLKVRELRKMVSTYYDHLIENAVDVRIEPNGRETGIIHCHFNQVEAMTGRFSSSGPNLQNMPRLLGPRECFIPRKSRRNWHFDYEQVEMKLFCHFARDRDMARAIEQDIHRYVASEIYGIPPEEVTKEQRKRAKAINFGIIYGSGPDKVAETLTRMGLHTTPAEARQLFARYHRRFPSVRRTTRMLERELKKKGHVVNPFGRRYFIERQHAYRCLNYMCQGTSAELIKRGMLRVWKYLRENGYKSKILIQVHDEIVVEMPRNEEAILVPKIIELLQDLESFFVPITVDAECAPRRWSKKVKASELSIALN